MLHCTAHTALLTPHFKHTSYHAATVSYQIEVLCRQPFGPVLVLTTTVNNLQISELRGTPTKRYQWVMFTVTVVCSFVNQLKCTFIVTTWYEGMRVQGYEYFH